MKTEEVLRWLLDLGILDATLEPSGEFHRRWRRFQISMEKNPVVMQKAAREGVHPQDSAMVPAIVSFFDQVKGFETGIHEKDIEIAYNIIRERLDAIPAIPYRE